MTQWNFQNKGKSDWTGKRSFVLEVPLRYLRPSVIYSVPCDQILQRAYCCGVSVAREQQHNQSGLKNLFIYLFYLLKFNYTDDQSKESNIYTSIKKKYLSN